MGCLSKIFKGSTRKVSEGRYDLRYGENTVGNYPSTSTDTWMENEDIDCAIALSLSEEDSKGMHVINHESQLKEDEQLARALQESLSADSPPRHRNGKGNRNRNGNGNANANANANGNGSGSGNGNIYQPIPFPYSAAFRERTFFDLDCLRSRKSLLTPNVLTELKSKF